jgi:hypothetical protein
LVRPWAVGLIAALAFAANCWVWGVPYRSNRPRPSLGRIAVIKATIGVCVIAALVLLIFKDSSELQKHLEPQATFAGLVVAIVALFYVLLPPQQNL